MNVCEQCLRAWHAKFVASPERCGASATLDEFREENRRRRKQLRRAVLEREFLKTKRQRRIAGILGREVVAVKYAWITRHRDP